ncbi:hypothetical protein WN51_00954 [Melipona quadrifasciata]|uniref:Uncharacterized protein n=1 Tax=Melipona quadrifasciata TaxID=166423 RepID=A0A0M8ZYC0_9HYME|nr:hypothetical protein WN51_00954 [Melipona quadrifasciata]
MVTVQHFKHLNPMEHLSQSNVELKQKIRKVWQSIDANDRRSLWPTTDGWLAGWLGAVVVATPSEVSQLAKLLKEQSWKTLDVELEKSDKSLRVSAKIGIITVFKPRHPVFEDPDDKHYKQHIYAFDKLRAHFRNEQ